MAHEIDAKITQIKSSIKRLEGVLRLSKNQSQKKRVAYDISQLKKELSACMSKKNRLDAQQITVDKSIVPFKTEKKKEPTISTDNKGKPAVYEVITKIPILKPDPEINDVEIIEIYSFLKFFEDDLWSMMSDYQLKLDFNLSQIRENFFVEYQRLSTHLKNYITLLKNMMDTNAPRSVIEQLKQNKPKEYRSILMSFAEFIHKLNKFTDSIIENYEQNGGSILNPDATIKVDDHSVIQKYQGIKIIDGVRIINKFTREILDYTNIPDFWRYKSRKFLT